GGAPIKKRTMQDLAWPKPPICREPSAGSRRAARLDAACVWFSSKHGNDSPSAPSPPRRSISRRVTWSHNRTAAPPRDSMNDLPVFLLIVVEHGGECYL